MKDVLLMQAEKLYNDLYNEKQQLINFLKGKIEANEDIIQMNTILLNDEFVDKETTEKIRKKLKSGINKSENEISAYQEVLDFVKGEENDN